jgi:ABC transporter substrate binding protein
MRMIGLMLAVAFTLTPLIAGAQRPAKPSQIGLLIPGASGASAPLVNEFRSALRELGYRDGENIIVQYRSAENDHNRLPELVAELVGLKVDVIVAVASTAAVAARKVTDTIPIRATRSKSRSGLLLILLAYRGRFGRCFLLTAYIRIRPSSTTTCIGSKRLVVTKQTPFFATGWKNLRFRPQRLMRFTPGCERVVGLHGTGMRLLRPLGKDEY